MPKVGTAQVKWVEIGPCRLLNADCLDYLNTEVDLVLTDPPYGINHPCNYKTRGRDAIAVNRDYPNVIGDDEPYNPHRILELHLPTILWGANHYASKLPDQGGWLVWDKMRPDDLDQATCELAWTNCVKGVRRFKHLWNGCMKDSQRGEGWHPTEKPIALMEWVLSLRWCAGFKTIFDPYMGSGSTGVACVRLGRKFIGIEKDPTYFKVACSRILGEWTALNGLSAPKVQSKHHRRRVMPKIVGESLPEALAWIFARIEPVPTKWLTGGGKASPRKELEPEECRSWRSLTEQWRLAMRWTEDMDVALSIMLAVCLSTEQQGDQQLFLQVIANAGCLHGDTPIFDPVTQTTRTVKERWKDGRAFHVWTMCADGLARVTAALPPYEFPEEDIYEVTFQSGRQIKTTGLHRFWNGQSYVTLFEVQDALREFGAYRLPSISERTLSTHGRGEPHSTQTVLGSQSRCCFYPYPCGGQLPAELGNGQYVFPLSIDAQEHIHFSSRMDGQESTNKCTPSEESCHLSTLDYPHQTCSQRVCETCDHPGGHTFSTPKSRNQTCGSIQPPAYRRDTQSEFLSSSRQTIDEVVTQLIHCAGDLWKQSKDKLPPSLLSPLSSAQIDISPESQQLLHQSEASACVSPQVVKHMPCIVDEWDDVVKIEKVCRETYFDFTVPGTENYWACGVFNHNSAKTRLADAILVSKHCKALEHLTGFHSGFNDGSGEDFSLLSRINRKTLVTPEGDVLMSNPKTLEIMSQARRIFDGTSQASYKNKKDEQKHEGLRTPWIICGTPALLNVNQSSLGDRFLRVIIDPPPLDVRREILHKVGLTALRTVTMRSNCDPSSIIEGKLLAAYRLTGGFVDHLRERAGDLLVSVGVDEESVVGQCATLAEFVADMRARPDANAMRNKVGERHDAKEMPTRLTFQFARLARCLAAVMGRAEIDAEVMRRVRKVALDTARGHVLSIVRNLWRRWQTDGQGNDSRALGVWIGEGEEKVGTLLKFMRRMDVVCLTQNNPPRWRLTDRSLELCREVL